MDNITWDEIYISMAHLFAMKSKDRSTKSGVVIVDQYNRVKSLGFNGFPPYFGYFRARMPDESYSTLHS